MTNVLKRDKSFYRQLLTVALPIAAQNLIVYSLSVIDTFFLGFIGENEIAAVTLANAPFFTIMLMIFGFQSGSSVLINQYWGKGDIDSINKVIGITFMTAMTLAFIVSLTTFLFPMQIMSFFTPDPILQTLAAQYMRIVAFSYTINIFTQVYVGAMRSMENAKIGMYISLVAMVFNIILNAIFIFGLFGSPKMGIAGAALGTLLSRIIELIVAIVYAMLNKRFKINIRMALRPGKAISISFFKYAGPVVINETLWGLGSSMYPAIFGRMGSEVVAAYSIATNLEKVFNVLSSGIGNASAVIIGKEIGAKRYENAKAYSSTIMAIAVLSSGVMAFLLFFLTPALVAFFNIPPSTKELAQLLLILYIVRFPLSALNFSTVCGIIRSGGDTKYSMVLDVSSLWLVGVALTAILAFIVKPPIIYIFIPLFLDELNKAFWSIRRIRSGEWINNITIGK